MSDKESGVKAKKSKADHRNELVAGPSNEESPSGFMTLNIDCLQELFQWIS
jgi:hypothetical protein